MSQMRELGRGGPQVGALGLGAMSFGGMLGPTSEEASFAAMDAAWDIGITHFDTANVYGPHTSEEVVGRWMKSRGHAPVIATKAGIQRNPERPANNEAAHLEAELDGSLRRLGVDHVALFYIHRREQAIPIEEVAGTMGRLIEAGKIGGWGLSEVSPTTLRRAHAITPVRAVQNEYSLWTRLPENGVIQECERLGVAFVPFSPLARGVFGREPIDVEAPDFGDFRRMIPRFHPDNWPANLEKARAFNAYARDNGVTAPALALAWVLAQGDHLIPIPGSRTADHIRDWAEAVRLTENAELLAGIDAILPIGWPSGDRYNDALWRLPEIYS